MKTNSILHRTFVDDKTEDQFNETEDQFNKANNKLFATLIKQILDQFENYSEDQFNNYNIGIT